MALYKLSKSKTFHLDYCGCTAAALLLNDQTIHDAIDFIRQVKTKRDFVRTTVTISRDGVKIIYNNEQKFSTIVPASMIAGSTVGKASLQDTLGVVYISPLTGHHYPAFVHVYRCDNARTAQKFLSRLRAYMLIENHRLRIHQLEQQLLDQNLLNIDRYNALKIQKTNTGISSSSNSSDSRQEQLVDPIKSITEEFQKKIDSQQPILFPPKDYDTIRANHGNIQRAQAWKSTEPTIVGYSPIDADDDRTRRHMPTNAQRKNSDILEKPNERLHLSSHRSDATVDPVETVSLAFDFLKDETGSIFTENDGNIEHVEHQQQNKPPIYRFRPPQINAVTKKILPRNNNYELTNNISPSNSSSRNDLDAHHNQHHYVQNGHKTSSEVPLYYEQQRNSHLTPQYESRFVNGKGVPMATNPIWTGPSSHLAGSQPNLLSYQNVADSTPYHRQLSPPTNRRIPSAPMQNSLYASYPDNKSEMMIPKQKKSTPAQRQLHRKQKTQSQYLDTNEFILRASNGQPLRSNQYSNRHVSKDYRPHSMNVDGTLLDVYY